MTIAMQTHFIKALPGKPLGQARGVRGREGEREGWGWGQVNRGAGGGRGAGRGIGSKFNLFEL